SRTRSIDVDTTTTSPREKLQHATYTSVGYLRRRLPSARLRGRRLGRGGQEGQGRPLHQARQGRRRQDLPRRIQGDGQEEEGEGRPLHQARQGRRRQDLPRRIQGDGQEVQGRRQGRQGRQDARQALPEARHQRRRFPLQGRARQDVRHEKEEEGQLR